MIRNFDMENLFILSGKIRIAHLVIITNGEGSYYSDYDFNNSCKVD